MLSFLTALVLGSAALVAQATPRLLADLEPRTRVPSSSNPDDFASFGPWTIFSADDGVHGRELFHTLGSAASTALFVDLVPGARGSDPRDITPVRNQVFFTADDGVHGREPWVSDGTPAGTHLVLDLTPGSASTPIGDACAVAPCLLFFVARPSGAELWSSDGTTAATRAVFDPANARGRVLTGHHAAIDTPAGPRLLFVATSALGPELWITDGTRSGTTIAVARLEWLGAVRFHLAAASRFVVFAADRPQVPAAGEVWITDGTATGTFLVGATVTAIPDVGTRPVLLPEFDGRAWFPAFDGAFAHASNGTAAGTLTVAGPAGVSSPMTGWLGVATGSLWLMADADLVRVDRGTITTHAQAPPPIPIHEVSRRGAPTIGGNFLVLDHRATLFAFDVRANAVLWLGPTAPLRDGPHVGGHIGRGYFARPSSSIGVEPAVSDGTIAGTGLLRDVNTQPPVTDDARITSFASFGRLTAIVGGGTGSLPTHLWCTDGTTAGTRLVYQGSGIEYVTPAADRLFFVADTPSGRGLHVSDGTVAGTQALPMVLAPGTTFTIEAITRHGADVVCVAFDGIERRLFVADGSTLAPLATLSGAIGTAAITTLGEDIVATVWEDLSFTAALWFVDRAGRTVRIAAGSQGRAMPVVMGSAAYFIRGSAANTNELWRSDGTANGTSRIATILHPVFDLAVARDHLFLDCFGALYVSDGTAVGTQLLPAIAHLQIPLRTKTTLGRRLLFHDQTPPHDVWVTDGTAAGTHALGPPRSHIDAAAIVSAGAERAIIAESTATNRREFWVSDGTSSGTRQLFDAGDRVPDPDLSALSNGLFYFVARDPLAGLEPHVLDIGASVQTLGHGCGGALRQATLFADPPGAPFGGVTIGGHATAGAAAWLMMSPPPTRPLAFPLGGTCVLEVDPLAGFLLDVLPVTNQRFARSYLLPDQPALYGLQAVVQAALAPTDAPLGADLSNGVLLTIGR